ncbi:hypothetical protein JRO89_XS03G0213400 [Xanthoceras sorbifolium]|uniref:Dymeclin n=1 Tax=Xanthoceras sorbifolium TaxID=99658 RepID=A0ABQ8IBL3_9ROSI|nr:hypothetical protein JRO89_XS03G0213400 [Xanthoceras sorbifolium]
MGAGPSTPRYSDAGTQDSAEDLIASFVGEKSFPLASELWQKLLELPLSLRWPSHRVHQACQLLDVVSVFYPCAAQNNCYTRHLAKILVHLTWCLQEYISSSGTPSTAYVKVVNAVYISSVFLKYLIENAQSDNFDELHLSLGESETIPKEFMIDQNIENLVMHSVLSFIASVDVSPDTYLLHQELLNFMLVAMSTQLLYGPSPGPSDVHPFIDAAMAEESSLVNSVVRRLLLNYITRPRIPTNAASYSIFSEVNEPGVFQRVGSAAATFVLLPFNYLVSSSGEGSRNPLADSSLLVLLVLIHYRKCAVGDESITERSNYSATSDSLSKLNTPFSDNPYCKALENARDIECEICLLSVLFLIAMICSVVLVLLAIVGHVDIEGNGNNGPVVRLPFASLFDTLGMCLADETAVLLLYSLVQGNSDFLEYVMVRTDLDTLV